LTDYLATLATGSISRRLGGLVFTINSLALIGLWLVARLLGFASLNPAYRDLGPKSSWAGIEKVGAVARLE